MIANQLFVFPEHLVFYGWLFTLNVSDDPGFWGLALISMIK